MTQISRQFLWSESYPCTWTEGVLTSRTRERLLQIQRGSFGLRMGFSFLEESNPGPYPPNSQCGYPGPSQLLTLSCGPAKTDEIRLGLWFVSSLWMWSTNKFMLDQVCFLVSGNIFSSLLCFCYSGFCLMLLMHCFNVFLHGFFQLLGPQEKQRVVFPSMILSKAWLTLCWRIYTLAFGIDLN